MSILIQGGEVVTASSRAIADVYCEDGKIQAVGRNLDVSADRTVDARGQYVVPGGIDPHVHMALPFMGTVSRDDFDSGTACAVAGGTTTLIDFCIPAKGESLSSALATWNDKSEGEARCDYSYHMAITDWNEEIRSELPMAVNDYGITSFKIFTAYKGALMLQDDQLYRLMVELKKLGGMVTAHAVNGDVLDARAEAFLAEGKTTPRYHPLCQPPAAEGEATNRVVELGHMAGVPTYIVHMTCGDAVEALERGRRSGRTAYGETCTQYLLLDEELYTDDFESAKYVLSPPLRAKPHQEVLWNAIRRGIIQVLGTDHCAFDFDGQKDMGKDDFTKIPNGFNGIEERMPLFYTAGVTQGRIDMNAFVALTSTNAARLFGLYPQKGTIAPGSDADLCVWDPEASGTISADSHTSRCDYNVYEGFDYAGSPSLTLVRGQVAYEDGEVKAEPGTGRYLKREPQAPPSL